MPSFRTFPQTRCKLSDRCNILEAMSSRIAGLRPQINTAQCRHFYQRAASIPSLANSTIASRGSIHTSPRSRRLPTQYPLRRTISTTTRSSVQQRYQAFVPPSPESLGKAAPAKHYRRSIKWGRRLLYVTAVTGAFYLIDTQLYASSITRSLRTFGLGIVVAADYKLNFRPEPWFGGSITDLHRRNAEKLFELLHQNGGLYLKIGQAIAMQSAVLPPEFQKMFARMFDDAPQNSWRDVEMVIREEFGQSPEEVFGVSFSNEPGLGVMEKKARASASVAQVHWARLADGREVAIKVQKREIAHQVGWDLWSFK